jgi:nitrous oxidase accessory protein NosD
VKRKVAGASFIVVALLFSAAGLTLSSLVGANPLPAPPILQVYIKSDGAVEPSTVPIQRAGNIYTFTGDFTNATVDVQCDNVVIDGAGFTLKGNGQHWNTGITLTNRSNVIIKNIDIRDYVWSISLTSSSNIIIYNNSMLTAWNIILDSSVGNQIIGNNITAQETGFGYCVHIENGAADNVIMGNNLVNAGSAVTVYRNSGENNTFRLNNFVGNSNDFVGWTGGVECNFWSDYMGLDGDGDGVGDTPYVITDYCQDRHPLMSPFDVSSVTVEMPEWANTPDLPEPFPAAPVVVSSVAIVAVVGVGLLVYLRRRSHRAEDLSRNLD